MKTNNIKRKIKNKKEKVIPIISIVAEPEGIMDTSIKPENYLGEEYKENISKIYKSADEIKLTLKTREDVRYLRNKILTDSKTPILRDNPAFKAIEDRRKYGRKIISSSNYNYNIERWVNSFNKLVADDNVFPDTISFLQEEINDGFAGDLDIEKADNFNDLRKLKSDILHVKYSEYFDLKKFILNHNKYSLKRIFNKCFNYFKKVKSDTDEVLCIERSVLAKNIDKLRRFDRFINKDIVISKKSVANLDLIDVQDNWSLVFNHKIVLYKISLKNDRLIYSCTRESIDSYENCSDNSDWWGKKPVDNSHYFGLTNNVGRYESNLTTLLYE